MQDRVARLVYIQDRVAKLVFIRSLSVDCRCLFFLFEFSKRQNG